MNAPYSSFISVRQTNEEMAKEQQRMYAIHNSGYSFIILRLKDKRMKKVSAVDDLSATKTQDDDGEETWKFNIVQKPLLFAMDPAKGRVAYMLDTDYNRDFLASHSIGEYWVISDVISGESGISKEDVIKDIKQRCETLAKSNKYSPGEEKKSFVVPHRVKEESEEEIDRQIEELTKKKSKFKPKVKKTSARDIVKVSKQKVFKDKKEKEIESEEMPFPDSDLIQKDTNGNDE